MTTIGSVTAAFVTLGLALGGCGSGATSSSSSASASSVSATPMSSPGAATSSASATPAPATPASGHVSVAVTGYAFHPAMLVVAPGTKVTFANHDQTAHTATAAGSGASGFDSGTIKPGASATVTFDKAGTYPYICQFHAFMHGTIVVR